MAFQWNVQPYRWLSELRTEYTQTVMAATHKRAETIAAEATQWMQDNAPWQDRTGRARAGLRAFVIRNQEENKTYQRLLVEARNQDAMLLDEINQGIRQHREDAYQRIVSLRSVGDRAGARRLRRNIRSQVQYQRRTSVPVGRSAVRAFEREWRGMRAPLVQVRFTHNQNLRYVIWLEIANQGRFAIISRAIDYWSPKLMGEIRKIANLKQYRDRIVASGGSVQADNRVLQENISPEEKFAQHMRGWEEFEGRPYEPWSEAVQARRKQRRKYYNPEQSRQARRARDEYLAKKGLRGRPLQEAPATMNIPIRRSR